MLSKVASSVQILHENSSVPCNSSQGHIKKVNGYFEIVAKSSGK